MRTNAQIAARSFLTSLRRDLGREIFEAVRQTKIDAPKSNFCAFHDVVDANEWLIDAATAAFDGDVTDEDGCMSEDFFYFTDEVYDEANALLRDGWDPGVDGDAPRLSWLNVQDKMQTLRETYHLNNGEN